MSAATASVLLAVLAGLLIVDPRAAAAARLSSLRDRRRARSLAGGLQVIERAAGADGSGADGSGADGSRAEPATWAARLVAVLAGVALVSGRGALAAMLVSLALALGVPPARRRRAAAAGRAAVARDLSRAADLTATCLEAGAAPVEALARVAGAIGGPLGVRLQSVATALGCGADPQAWPIHADDPLSGLLRAVARATATGAPLADTVRDVASDARERERWEALERARRAGVHAVGPLAACFLPAFVLVGVVPVVAGVARSLLAGWA